MSFKIRDLVLLLGTFIRQICLNKKLSDKFLGPFEVIEKAGSQVYRLKLLYYFKIHNIFYISLLEQYYRQKGKEQNPGYKIIKGNCHDLSQIQLDKGIWECVKRLNIFDYRSRTKETKYIEKKGKIYGRECPLYTHSRC